MEWRKMKGRKADIKGRLERGVLKVYKTALTLVIGTLSSMKLQLLSL